MSPFLPKSPAASWAAWQMPATSSIYNHHGTILAQCCFTDSVLSVETHAVCHLVLFLGGKARVADRAEAVTGAGSAGSAGRAPSLVARRRWTKSACGYSGLQLGSNPRICQHLAFILGMLQARAWGGFPS